MINVQLSDTVAAALQAQATAQGMTIEAYLETIAFSRASDAESRLSFDEFERLLDAESGGGASPTGTFSRAQLYSDHD